MKKGINKQDNEEIDITKLKYVLYARKSTTDESRQIRSIEDQINDCKERIIKPLHLNVVDIFQEKKSAKIPNQRPIFNQIIE